ncbi:adaptin ear-binding coat-associated protein 2-like [Saccoglossus kowalevskii]|uniref:Adaptin ear-binding coat-associated protein 1-like n=1 Tax=Saccoglossus kowalevskii TaxID=10224 RepID=A0ABM0GWM1_SACKO|nr:PREDICTED: adaptin ear-binding coat-associated protein 1-like [Saccoglossus kowalevskii]
MATEYESVICVKNDTFVFRIPPRPSNRGYRAADWKLDNPDWKGRLRVIAKGNDCIIKLEDKASGELFAKCPVDSFPGIAVESVLDSSRYFVIRLLDDNGRSAFIGMGFADRSDSFDFNVALQDHFKWVKQSKKLEQEEAAAKNDPTPKLDLGFKEGQTIKINIGNKSTGLSRPKAASSGTAPGFLPPPPGSKIPTLTPPPLASQQFSGTPSQGNTGIGSSSSTQSSTFSDDLLGGLTSVPTQQPQHSTSAPTTDDWGDFTSARSSSSQGTQQASDGGRSDGGGWVQF